MIKNLNQNHFQAIMGIVIWTIAVLFFLYEFFLRVFMGTLADQIIPDLGLSVAGFTLVTTSYSLAYGIMQVPVGILVDKFGTKKILGFATATCAMSTFLFAISHGTISAIIIRIIMGLGSSFGFICLLMIISTWFSRKNFAFLSGVSQFIGTMGPLLAGGPLVAALALTHGSWRILLSYIGIFGFLLFTLTILFVKDKKNRDTNQLIQLTPKIPTTKIIKKLLKNKQAWWVGLYSASVYVPLSLIGSVWGTSFLEAHGYSQRYAASIVSIAWFGYAIGCVLTGLYSDKTRYRKPVLRLTALIGLISSVILLYFPQQHVVIYQILFFTIGFSASGQNIGFAAMAEHVSKKIRGSALGFNNTFIIMVDTTMQTATGLIINHSARAHDSHAMLNDYISGLSIMPILYFFSLIISSILFKETYCKSSKEIVILKPNVTPIIHSNYHKELKAYE